ncbi:HTH CenpB-type DNA-binding domain [Trinorchestia longiramus]|nr:HTH CenpB-type DNA-binding domain [Trinorchestia longiramus]
MDCTASKKPTRVLHQLIDSEVKRLCCRHDFIKQEAAAENFVHVDTPNPGNLPRAMTMKSETPDDELDNITVKVEPIDWDQEPQVSSSAVSSTLTFKKEVDKAWAESHAGSTEAENEPFVMTSKRKETHKDQINCSRKRTKISLEQKIKIIKRVQCGESQNEIARELCLNRPTVANILRSKSKYKELLNTSPSSIDLSATNVSYRRTDLIVEMEEKLVEWLKIQNENYTPVSSLLLQEKAIAIYDSLKSLHRGSSKDEKQKFVASRGWLHRFKKRANLHNVKLQDEAADADRTAENEFPNKLADFITDGQYCPQQIFNVDETGLFWKRSATRTFIENNEKSAPGHKTAKDRLTLLLGGNAAGDCKLKPMLVYRSQNPRALKGLVKASLPVIWKANAKAWVTRTLFNEWFLNHFIPECEGYCNDQKIPFKILLLLDNAPGHPASLGDMHPNVKVIYLPPNTTSILQPMDQGVIASFKAYYLRRTFAKILKENKDEKMSLKDIWKKYDIYSAIKNIADSWAEVKQTSMKEVWKNLCPQFFLNNVDVFNVPIDDAKQDVIGLAKELKLNVSQDDIENLMVCSSEEDNGVLNFSSETDSDSDDDFDSERTPVKMFTATKLDEAFTLISDAMKLLELQDPNSERFCKFSRDITNSLQVYRSIYNEKKNDKYHSCFAVKPSM